MTYKLFGLEIIPIEKGDIHIEKDKLTVKGLDSNLLPAQSYDYTLEILKSGLSYKLWRPGTKRVCGFIFVEDKTTHYYISAIYIVSELRGRGYADRLLKYVLDKYNDKDFMSDIEEDNAASIALFTKHGFKNVGKSEIGFRFLKKQK